MEYNVERARDLSLLITNVNEAMAKGWIVVGGIVREHDGYYLQTMVKMEGLPFK